jgi:ectoine hydroxylase-related dioxygenase (phytanoyl-CoA dioxygenase family)
MPIHAALPEAHSESIAPLDPSHIAMADPPEQERPRLRAGDAVVIDYRLLHGTHANTCDSRRDCILLSFTPSWKGLPEDIRAHLIDHPALPSDEDGPLLPAFSGVRRTLALNRNAPREFVCRT